MIRFSLVHLQAESPYALTLVGDSFMFLTDFGIHYSVSFSKEDIVLGGCVTYQFVIRKIDEVRSQHDPKVEKTIFAILDEFFRSNLEIMLYMCDTSDGREGSRNRLFLAWFERYAEKGRFTIRTASTNIEGQGFFIGIVVENRNPKLKEITEDFDMKAEMLTSNKPL